MGLLYGFWSGWTEMVGPFGLFLTAALCGLIAFYLTVTGRRFDNRPEDNPNALISEQEGDYGFFTPYSWWPLWLGLTAAICFLGLAVGWWLFIIGAFFGIVSTRRLDVRALQGRVRQLTRIPAGRLTAEPGSPRSIGAKRRTSWGDQSQPSSWSRSSLIPKWCATSCTTVTAISSSRSSRSSQSRVSGPLKMVIRSGSEPASHQPSALGQRHALVEPEQVGLVGGWLVRDEDGDVAHQPGQLVGDEVQGVADRLLELVVGHRAGHGLTVARAEPGSGSPGRSSRASPCGVYVSTAEAS